MRSLSEAPEKIPATIITGFLGAGKTTLVRHALAQANGRRIAVIVNEFGALGIDGELLKSCGIPGCAEDNIVELANGCLCCTVAEDFLPTMSALLDRAEKPSHILIETSGLAPPKPLLMAFTWPSIRERVTVDGVIAVLDGPAVAAGRFADDPVALEAQRRADPALDHDNPLAEVFEDQINAADLILLNKSDLLDAAARESLARELVARLPRGVKVLSTVEGKIAPAILFGLGAQAEDDLSARPSHHDSVDGAHEHDDFDSFIVDLPESAEPASVIARLGTLAEAHDILRIKGFLAINGKAMRCVVQGVGVRFQHYFDRPWRPDEKRQGSLVVIGKRGIDRAAIATALAG